MDFFSALSLKFEQSFLASLSLSLSLGGALFMNLCTSSSVLALEMLMVVINSCWGLVPSFGYLDFVLALSNLSTSSLTEVLSIYLFLLLLAFSLFSFLLPHTTWTSFLVPSVSQGCSWIIVDGCHKFMLGVVRPHLLVGFF
ncbi:hypothetical protein JHK85_000743 [Glycine max]|uniref:Uncharacterized protein n=1 Tax=Glycine max TaxID=3847 RepID=K7K2A8_SOYBN|nr:hypothetical protein JHK85_000743 [Glycine max]KAH1161968.1 hypothetical protein GYH30_000725 [Glycine max]